MSSDHNMTVGNNHGVPSPQTTQHDGLQKPPRVLASSHHIPCELGEVNCGELVYGAGAERGPLEGETN